MSKVAAKATDNKKAEKAGTAETHGVARVSFKAELHVEMQ